MLLGNIISDHLRLYYSRYAERLIKALAPLSVNPAAVRRAVGLLIPYFEGYSITSTVCPHL